jgi:RecJ-like exonuclease
VSTTDRSETFTIACSVCKYAGEKTEKSDECPVCHGESVILLKGSPKDYMDCYNCTGTGFVGFQTSSVCSFCQGVGAIKRPERRQKTLSKP